MHSGTAFKEARSDLKRPLYSQKLGFSWWLRSSAYFGYMLRELSGLFVAIYALIYVFQLSTLSAGQSDYAAFMATMSSTPIIVLNLIFLGFAVYHSLTWFNLTSKVQPVKLGTRIVPKLAVFGVNILIWIAASLAIYFLIFVGVFI
ncbi:MAG: hypothetical protein ACE5KO_03965 [Candidatus Bathyarchaeia archaeon]